MVLLIDNMVDLHKIDFHLLIELIWNAGRADVGGTWPGPLTAYGTRLDNIGDIVNGGFGNSDFLQELFHSELRNVPPSYM